MRTVLATCITAAIATLASIASAYADDRPSNTIAVAGYAKIEVPAEFATITLGVMTQGATVAQTSAQNAASMTAVVNALRKLGIADKDIQTSAFNVSPRYEPRPPGAYDHDALRPIIGYSVSNTVWVKVRDMADVSRVVDGSIAAGANSVGGIGFSIEDDPELMDRARTAAVANARHKAQVLAAAANLSIVRAISITDGEAGNPYLNVTGSRAQLTTVSPVTGGAETPIMARRIHVEARVTVLYAVK